MGSFKDSVRWPNHRRTPARPGWQAADTGHLVSTIDSKPEFQVPPSESYPGPASGKRSIALAASSFVRFSMSSAVQDSFVARSAFSDSPLR